MSRGRAVRSAGVAAPGLNEQVRDHEGRRVLEMASQRGFQIIQLIARDQPLPGRTEHGPGAAWTRSVRGNPGRHEVSRAGLVAALSLAADIGYGQPMQHMLRSSWIALGLARRLGLDASQRAVVYYVGLLACVGCSADAHERARWFGDDLEFKADIYEVDLAGLPMARWMVRHLGAGAPPLRRARVGFEFLAGRSQPERPPWNRLGYGNNAIHELRVDVARFGAP